MKFTFFNVVLFSIMQGITHQSVFAQAGMDTVPVIHLHGDGYSKGLQHGRLLKKEIASVFAKWKSNIEASTRQHPDSVLKSFIASTSFEPIIKKYTPSLIEEIKGIAAGAGQPYEDVFAFQLIDEFWVYLDKQYHTAGHHCSGIGVAGTATSPAYIAQNVDLENYMHGFQVLLHIPASEKEPAQYIISCAGLVAVGGMNEKGIALCMNSVMELTASEDGLPVAFMVRAVLAKQNGNEALQFLKETKHASGQNYIVGVADSVYDFEASANDVVRFVPPTKNNVVYHTNHAMVNHDVKPWYKKYHPQVLSGETAKRNSEVRFACLQQRLNKSASITQDIIKETLSSKDDAANPVCRVYKEHGGGFTFSSVIYTLTGNRSVQITYGSPGQSAYKEYFFSSDK